MSERRSGAGVKTPRAKPGTARGPKATPEMVPPPMEAALLVSQRLDIEGQVRAMLDIGRTWASSSDGLAFALDPEGNALTHVAGTLRGGDARAVALIGAVAEREGGRWASGAFPFDAGGLRALGVPLRGAADTVVAAVVLLEPVIDAAGALTELAERVRPAVANAMSVRAIRELTIRDDTAACFNRRYFEEFIVEELARANRFKAPMSLIFFDMDNLKEVNTRFGHGAGSRALLEVSQRVRTKVRKFDKVFRFGGDEFCIVLPETEWHGALEVAERVREAIASRPLLSDLDLPVPGVAMTASFGIASFPLHARTKEDLVQRSDRAMQSIKMTLKNGIAVAERPRDADGV